MTLGSTGDRPPMDRSMREGGVVEMGGVVSQQG